MRSTVGELLQRMTRTEWLMWCAFAKDQPFGPEGDDLRFGTLAALQINANRGRGKRPVRKLDEVFAWHRRRGGSRAKHLEVAAALRSAAQMGPATKGS